MNRKSLGKIALTSFLIVAHISIVIGGMFALKIGRMRFFGLFLYAIVALFLFDLFLILQNSLHLGDDLLNMQSEWRGGVDIRMVTIFLLATITAFALVGRGWVPYLFASLTGGMIAFWIKQRQTQTIGPVLVLIALILAVLLLSRVFTVQYLTSTNDTVKHAEIAKTIIESGTISQLQNTRYDGFSIFHILLASLARTISVSARTAAGLLFAIIFPASIIATYVFLVQRGLSKKLASLSILLLAFSPPILTWGSKVHYQSLSYVYFTFGLLLLFGRDSIRHRRVIIGIPVFAAWVSSHHLSVFMTAVLLVFPAVADVISILKEDHQARYFISILYLIIVAKWTVFSSWLGVPIGWITQYSPQSSQGVGSTGLLVTTYTSLDELFISAIPFFIDYLHLSLLLSLFGIGVIAILKSQKRVCFVFICAVIGGVFLFPNPLWIPLRGIATLLRWNIMVQPFVIVPLGVGLFILIKTINVGHWLQYSGSMMFVIALIFLMISAGFYAPTTSDFVGADRHDVEYLTDQDIGAAEWVKMYTTSGQRIYATSRLPGYLAATTNPIYGTDKYQRSRVTGIPGRVIFNKGIMIFQQDAFRTEAIKVSVSPNSKYYSSNGQIKAPVSASQITYEPVSEDLIYTNGDTVIHRSNSKPEYQESLSKARNNWRLSQESLHQSL